MRIYLAARYEMRFDLVERARELSRQGHEITSGWIYGKTDIELNTPDAYYRVCTQTVADLTAADCLLGLAETPGSYTTGAHHVEMGIALALGKRIMRVGPREHIFDWLPVVEHFDTWRELIDFLWREGSTTWSDPAVAAVSPS